MSHIFNHWNFEFPSDRSALVSNFHFLKSFFRDFLEEFLSDRHAFLQLKIFLHVTQEKITQSALFGSGIGSISVRPCYRLPHKRTTIKVPRRATHILNHFANKEDGKNHSIMTNNSSTSTDFTYFRISPIYQLGAEKVDCTQMGSQVGIKYFLSFNETLILRKSQ